jgi:hypothetical protein
VTAGNGATFLRARATPYRPSDAQLVVCLAIASASLPIHPITDFFPFLVRAPICAGEFKSCKVAVSLSALPAGWQLLAACAPRNLLPTPPKLESESGALRISMKSQLRCEDHDSRF